MPSSATITAFVTMVAGTKARANHVNTNFSNYRGHILPIDPNTIASAHNTYKLGAPDAEWVTAYLHQPPFINGSQIGRLEIDTLYDGSLPPNVVDDIGYMPRIGFPDATATSVRFNFVVPQEYVTGNRIAVTIRGYLETSGGSAFTMESVAAFYRNNRVDDVSLTSPANVLTSTANVFAATTTVGTMFADSSLKLTGATGLINSLTVTAGDVITVDLKRTGAATADTNTGSFFLTNVVVDLNN